MTDERVDVALDAFYGGRPVRSWPPMERARMSRALAAADAGFVLVPVFRKMVQEPAADAARDTTGLAGLVDEIEHYPWGSYKINGYGQHLLSRALAALRALRTLPDSQGAAGWRDHVRALRAIAEGYPVTGMQDRWIVVENPAFREDDGADPNLVIDTWAIGTLDSQGAAGWRDLDALVSACEREMVGEVCQDEPDDEPVAVGAGGWKSEITFGMIRRARRALPAAPQPPAITESTDA